MNPTLLLLALLSQTPSEDQIELRRSIELNDGPLARVVFSPDGKSLATCGDRLIQVFDIETGERLRQFQGHSKPHLGLEFSPDGRFLVSSSLDKGVRLWDMRSGKPIRTFQRPWQLGAHEAANWLSFSPDGKQLVVCSKRYGDSACMVICNVRTGAWDYMVAKPFRSVIHTAFSDDGKRMAIAENCGAIVLYDVADDGLRERSPEPAIVKFKVDLSPCVMKHKKGTLASCVEFSPDGKRLLSCGWDNTIRVWNIEKKGQLELRIDGPRRAKAMQAVAFVRNGSRIVSVTRNEVVQLWDATDGTLLATATSTDKAVRSLALSPNGTTMATCGGEGIVKLWDLRFGQRDRDQ